MLNIQQKECWIYFLNPAFFLFKYNPQHSGTSKYLHVCIPEPHFMTPRIRQEQHQIIYDYLQHTPFKFRVKNQDKNIFQSRKPIYNKS